MNKKILSLLNIPVALTAVFLLATTMLLDAKSTIEALKGSITVCLDVIVPSLFGFMLISSFLIRSGLHRIVFRPLFMLLRFVVHVSEEEFSVLMLSLVGGYPVGAKLLYDLHGGSTDDCALNRSILYCYCGSPVFLMSIAGLSLYGDPLPGLVVYLSNVLACLILAVLMNCKRPVHAPQKVKTEKISISLGVISDSVHSSCVSLVTVCGMILFFGIIIQAVGFALPRGLSAYALAFLEISFTASLPQAGDVIFPVVCAIASFGGCCIVMQIAALTKGRVKLGAFAAARVCTAAISAVAGFAVMKLTGLIPEAGAHSSATTAIAEGLYENSYLYSTGKPIASLMLLVMAMLFIYVVHSGKKTV